MKRTIFVSGLPFRMSSEQVRALFVPFGEVAAVELHADWVDPREEPYALVSLLTESPAAAVAALDGKKLGRAYLRVHERAA